MVKFKPKFEEFEEEIYTYKEPLLAPSEIEKLLADPELQETLERLKSQFGDEGKGRISSKFLNHEGPLPLGTPIGYGSEKENIIKGFDLIGGMPPKPFEGEELPDLVQKLSKEMRVPLTGGLVRLPREHMEILTVYHRGLVFGAMAVKRNDAGEIRECAYHGRYAGLTRSRFDLSKPIDFISLSLAIGDITYPSGVSGPIRCDEWPVDFLGVPSDIIGYIKEKNKRILDVSAEAQKLLEWRLAGINRGSSQTVL